MSVDALDGDRRDVVVQQAGLDAVDADDERGLARQIGDRRARRGRGADLLLVGDGVLQIDDDRVGAEARDLAELARVAPRHEQQRPQQPIRPIHSFSLVASARRI